MGFAAIVTISVIVIAMILFITELISVDVVALGIMVTLVISGVISSEQAVKGFANEAVITVMCMFVLSASIIKSNAINSISPMITRLFKKGYTRTLLGLSAVVGPMSAFINNTPVVATFIPVISQSAKKANISPARFLIPLSFVAMFGGMCTLIGTSTNLLVSTIAHENGELAFSMFLFAPLGLIFSFAGILYLLIYGKRLIPEREELSDFTYYDQINNFLTEVKYDPDDEIEKTSLKDLFDLNSGKIKVISIKHQQEIIKNCNGNTTVHKGDVMLIKGGLDKIQRILNHNDLTLLSKSGDKEFPEEETKLVELILQPNSDILRQRIKDIDFRKKYQATVLGIRQRGKAKFSNLGDIQLKSGDVLLIQTSEKGYDSFVEYQKTSGSPFLILKESNVSRLNKRSLLISALTIIGVITVATLGLVPISIAALAGIVVLNISGVLSMEEAYKAVDWQIIFLLAGALSLEKAMNESGVSEMLGQFLLDNVGTSYGPTIVVSILYLMTSLITGIISNNAAAALFAPIGISIAHGMDASPTPLLLAIAFASSASFFTPIGYQTNTMVYSAGNYKFKDFFIVGGPLNLIFWILATLLIPIIYPF